MASEIPGLKHEVLAYGDHSLQRVGIWQRPGHEHSSAPWIVFVHGGAWRDPNTTLYALAPAIKHLMASGSGFDPSRVGGFASINYRLSPHPDHPQDAATTHAHELRVAKHPDHLDDVRSALIFLHAKCGVNRYGLLGHSAGATLAYQLLFLGEPRAAALAPPPLVVCGIAGAWNIAGLADRHPGYDTFLGPAFGPPSDWAAASPALFTGSYARLPALAFGKPKPVLMLAASTGDSIVDMPEVESMEAKLREDGVDFVAVKTLKAEHDNIWEDGVELADLIVKALDLVKQ